MCYLFLVAVCVMLGSAVAQSGDCVDADPMVNYTMDLFDGVWYDVAKIQTPLGALTVARCVCSCINSTEINEENGDTDVLLGCNLDAPDGELSLLTGELREMQLPGEWDAYTIKELRGFPISWTNILLTEDYGITYDCGRAATTVEYCIHFVSRTRTLDPVILEELVAYAQGLGLNPRDIELDYVDHEGCAPLY